MIEIGVIDNPRMAQAFVDYLAVQKISAKVAATEEGFAIYLTSMTHAEEASKELELFLIDPYQRKYQAASWDSGNTDSVAFKYSSGHIGMKFIAHAGKVTLSVLLLSVVIFVSMYALLLINNDVVYRVLHFPYDLSITSLVELWRLFTPIFLHFTVLHIVFNSLWWWYLGGQIENIAGSKKLLLLLFVSALISNVGQFILSGPNFGGLSGVVYALLGYMWWSGWLNPKQGICLPNAYVGFMLVWLILGFFPIFGLNIANAAHVLGLLVGCGQALFDAKTNLFNSMSSRK